MYDGNCIQYGADEGRLGDEALGSLWRFGMEEKMEDIERTKLQKEIIIQKLKEEGCRITRQRLMLLDIILEKDCSCCKEIYYQASRIDPGIGAATVYRMINTLEKIGAINRKNMYKISFGAEA